MRINSRRASGNARSLDARQCAAREDCPLLVGGRLVPERIVVNGPLQAAGDCRIAVSDGQARVEHLLDHRVESRHVDRLLQDGDAWLRSTRISDDW